MEHWKLRKEKVSDILPLTTMQKSMLFLMLMMPESDYYYEQQVYTICDVRGREVLLLAWNYLVKQNPSLRTLFRWKELEHPIQLILKSYQVPIQFQSLIHLAEQEKEKAFAQICQKQWIDKPNIEEAPLKVMIVQTEDRTYEMILTYHHIILDGWSNAVLLHELYEACKAYEVGISLEVKEKKEYKYYIEWLYKLDKDRNVPFWKHYLEGCKPNRMESAFSFHESQVAYYSKPLDDKLYCMLKEFAKTNRVTIASILYTAWGEVLSEYQRTRDVLFGITVSGRPSELEGIEETVGLFIHTVPLRFQLESDISLSQMVKKINGDLIEIQQNQYIPFEKTFSQLAGVEGQMFDTVVTIQNYPVDDKLCMEDEGVHISLKDSRYVTDLKLVLGIKMFSGHYQIDFCYNEQLLDASAVWELDARYRYYLERIVKERKP